MLLFAGLIALAAVSATALTGMEEMFAGEDAEEDDALPVSDENEAFDAPSPVDVAVPSMQEGVATVSDAPVTTGWRIVEGTGASDTIIAGETPEMILGREGDDTIAAGDGADELHGGAGNDLVEGGNGPDTVHGDDGDDRIDGGAGDDRLFGHNDADTVSGGAGHDSVVGSAGNDRLYGDAGDDVLHGALDDDWLEGGSGADTLFGGHGNDTVIGTLDDPATGRFDDTDDGRDFLNGGGGADVILAGRADIVTTGSGADTVLLGGWLSAQHQPEILDFSADEDMIMVFYDGTGPEPEIAIAPDADNPEDQRLLLDGVEIARIANAAGLTLAHVALVPDSELAGIARL